VAEKNDDGRNFARRRTTKKASSGFAWAPPEAKRQHREERRWVDLGRPRPPSPPPPSAGEATASGRSEAEKRGR
jgi:hypothetical protein